MAHYFDCENVKSEEKTFTLNLYDNNFSFKTDNSVFAKNGLDEGSKLLIDEYVKNSIFANCKCDFLDYGCGLGVVGIICAKQNKLQNTIYVDINSRATNLTQKNLALNNLTGKVHTLETIKNIFDNCFNVILLNPPIRTGNKNLFEMFENSFNSLKTNGELYVVLRFKQGAKTYAKHIENLFKNSKELGKNKGFVVYRFIKQ